MKSNTKVASKILISFIWLCKDRIYFKFNIIIWLCIFILVWVKNSVIQLNLINGFHVEGYLFKCQAIIYDFLIWLSIFMHEWEISMKSRKKQRFDNIIICLINRRETNQNESYMQISKAITQLLMKTFFFLLFLDIKIPIILRFDFLISCWA